MKTISFPFRTALLLAAAVISGGNLYSQTACASARINNGQSITVPPEGGVYTYALSTAPGCTPNVTAPALPVSWISVLETTTQSVRVRISPHYGRAVFRSTWLQVVGSTSTTNVRQTRYATHRKAAWDGSLMAGFGVADLATGQNWFIRTAGAPHGWWWQPNGTLGATGYFSPVNFAWGQDQLVPGDYDGDGIRDIAVFKPTVGMWQMHPSSGACPPLWQHPGGCIRFWGRPGDKAVPGDLDGDGINDLILYRNGEWESLNTLGCSGVMENHRTAEPNARRCQLNATYILRFGGSSGQPFVGDFDGNGSIELGVKDPDLVSGQTYFRLVGRSLTCSTAHFPTQSSSGRSREFTQCFRSMASWEDPLPADFDGDGKDDFAVHTYVNGYTYLLPSSGTCPAHIPLAYFIRNDNNAGQGYALCTRASGPAAATPVVADYDGDGKADFGWYWSANGAWGAMPSSGSCPAHITNTIFLHPGNFPECIFNTFGGSGYRPLP